MLRNRLQLCPLHAAVLVAADRLPVVTILQRHIQLIIRHLLDLGLVAAGHVVVDELTDAGGLDLAVLGDQDLRVPIDRVERVMHEDRIIHHEAVVARNGEVIHELMGVRQDVQGRDFVPEKVALAG